MMERNVIALTDLITLKRGFDLPSRLRVEGNIPVVASTGITGWHNESKVEPPGVVIGRSGSIGGGQYVTQRFWPLNTTLWVKDFKGHIERYIYYVLKNINFDRFNSGSGVPTLNRNHLDSLFVVEFSQKEEQFIATTLGKIDDKISLLRQQNETLEQLAQTLFKRWFVDFEFPDAQGQPYKSAGGKMIESELGEIPEGWEVSTIDKITLKVTDGTHSTVIDNSKGEYYLLSCKNIKNGLVLTSSKDRKIDFDTLKQLRKRTGLSKNDILITTVGTIGQAAILRKDQIPFELQRSVAIIRPNTDLVLPEYLYQLIRSRYFQHEAISRSEGSVQTCLFLGAIKSIEVILPNYNIIQQFNFLLQATYQKFENNLNEIQTLTRLRDTLLPKLMSGELRLGE